MPNCPVLQAPLRKRSAESFISRDEAQDAFWNFARGWIKRAFMDQDAFSAFIHLWVVFNAWASVVVHDDQEGRESDKFLVSILGYDPLLSSHFDKLLQTDRDFRRLSTHFSALWPVFEVRILRRLNIRAWDGQLSTRNDYVAEVVPQVDGYRDSLPHNRRPRDRFFAPPCFRPAVHSPNDWPHTLRAIYMVRCNLFHGGKTFDRIGDQQFVDMAYRILKQIWQIEIPRWLKWESRRSDEDI